ncbi:hypothetical protein RJT34_31267 [Clitoria ternatea]|uniref:Uncharacterized protein n=1 Tax=Clitoria ternatea TaxID=43366 RepID=A0AAN9F1S9_CLITE
MLEIQVLILHFSRLTIVVYIDIGFVLKARKGKQTNHGNRSIKNSWPKFIDVNGWLRWGLGLDQKKKRWGLGQVGSRLECIAL